jgi:hypothetical protein
MMKHADSVFEKIKLRGKWYLPENPDHKVDGVLTGSEVDGYQLTLCGSVNPKESVGSHLVGESPETVPLIHGDTFAGLVTLCDVFSAGMKVMHGGAGTLHEFRYCPAMFLKGVHVEAGTGQICFSKISSKLSVLCDWIDARVFSDNWLEMLKEDRSRLDIKFKFPNDILVYENDLYSINLKFVFAAPGRRIGQNDVRIDWEPYFVIESKGEELPLRGTDGPNYSTIIAALNQFLVVATFGACYPFGIVGYSAQFEEVPTGDSEKTHKTQIEVHREYHCTPAKHESQKILFPWKSVADKPSVYFGNWFEIFPMLRGPIALFIDSISRKNSYTPERFFNLVLALEGLHRFKFPEMSVVTETHTDRITGIVDAVPPPDKKWLSQKLEYSHEPSLRRRLKDLAMQFRDVFEWLVGAEGNARQKKEWSLKVTGAIADSRNALAHSLPEPGKDPGIRYYHLTGIAELLMAMHLMKEIGFDDEAISKRMQSNCFTSQYREQVVKFLKEEL